MSTLTLNYNNKQTEVKLDGLLMEAEELLDAQLANGERMREIVQTFKAIASGTLVKLNDTENEFTEFATHFQMMRSHQTDYFAAAKKCSGERTTENYTLKKEALQRAKNAEERLDAKAVELLKAKA
jgi:hypothetical protein